MNRFASRGLIDRLKGLPGHPCKHEWPEDCFVQCGESGLVLTKQGNYNTAFFEAFPRNPDTFIRGEGECVELAEQDCWQKYQRIVNCPSHEFEERGRTDGAGWCKHCDLFMTKVFTEHLHPCCICGEPTHSHQDTKGLWYCSDHIKDVPDENLTPTQLQIRQALREMSGNG